MKNKNYLYYGSTGLLTIMMLGSGTMQVLGMEQAVNMLIHVGIQNMWLIKLIGMGHILGGIGLWVPRMSYASYCALAYIFLGAFVAHFGVGDPMGTAMAPLLPSALLAMSYWSSPLCNEYHAKKGFKRAA